MAPRKKITPDQFEKAVEAIKNGEKIVVAAKHFGVPRITLHDKISGITTMGCLMGPSTVLTKGEEDILEKWMILALSERHIPLTKDSLLDSVQKIIIDQNRPNSFTNNRPSKEWFQSFMKRHPNLTQRVPDNLSRAPDNVSINNIRTWFTCRKLFG
ncbi:unnamed protein product [Arctia plantaginis]|uniref:HTH CENPB-type domain-containing protein n=1 Tax=Arctia plantaginis TaxID=874455 RepID=A0A8S0ZLQ8_ARCPL|nr:unnamed protein product [Arctia plantaginis]